MFKNISPEKSGDLQFSGGDLPTRNYHFDSEKGAYELGVIILIMLLLSFS